MEAGSGQMRSRMKSKLLESVYEFGSGEYVCVVPH